jgi:hypothetical protein
MQSLFAVTGHSSSRSYDQPRNLRRLVGRSRLYTILQLSLGLLLSCQAGMAQQPAPALNYLPGGTEVAGRAPDLLTHLRDDRFAVVDPLDASIVIIARNGRVLGRSQPLPFVPTELTESGTSITFLDRASGQSVMLDRSVDPRQLGALNVTIAPAAAAPAPAAALRRTGNRSVLLPVPGRRLRVKSLENGYLSDLKFLGQDARRRIYVQTTEIVRDDPIDVRTFVQRFSAAGRLIDAARVPISDMDSVPSRYAALSPSGDVTVVVPTATGLYFQILAFQTRAQRARPAAAAPPPRIPIDATIQKSSKVEAIEPAPAAQLQPTTRAEVLQRAQDYLNVNWTLRAENFSHDGIENRCAKEEGKYWLRPRRFTQASINQTFGPMPYHWGGDDTKQKYLVKMSQNKLAGSVCTCREPEHNYCAVSEAAGVDCSGFISGCWNVPKHGTSNLSAIADSVVNLANLRPGDALNKAGSHVRLFVGFKPGAAQVFQVIESATNLRCEGVCRSEYTADQLVGYKPLRFKMIQEQ